MQYIWFFISVFLGGNIAFIVLTFLLEMLISLVSGGFGKSISELYKIRMRVPRFIGFLYSSLFTASFFYALTQLYRSMEVAYWYLIVVCLGVFVQMMVLYHNNSLKPVVIDAPSEARWGYKAQSVACFYGLFAYIFMLLFKGLKLNIFFDLPQVIANLIS